jgi:hypothetical protein
MKFEIDTVAKTVTLDESVKLGDFILQMQVMFPLVWEQYTLIPKSYNYTPFFEPIKRDPLYPDFPSMPVMYHNTPNTCNSATVYYKDGKYTDYAGNTLNVTHT